MTEKRNNIDEDEDQKDISKVRPELPSMFDSELKESDTIQEEARL